MVRRIFGVAALLALAASAHAQTELIVNGGFETGTLAGWQVFNQDGSAGTFQIGDGTQTNAFGPISPVEQYNNAGALSGRYYATTDSLAPGTDGPASMVLYQEIGLSGYTHFSSAHLVVNAGLQDYSGFGPLNVGGSLDYLRTPLTQFIRIDLIRGGVDAESVFTVDPTDILQNLFLGGGIGPSDIYESGELDIADLLNQELARGDTRVGVRFAVVAGGGFFHLNVDDVSLQVTGTSAPEPTAGALVGLGLLALALRRRRR